MKKTEFADVLYVVVCIAVALLAAAIAGGWK